MSPANLSPDAWSVVRAFDALTTQVRRVADALSTPVAVLRATETTTANDALQARLARTVEEFLAGRDGWTYDEMAAALVPVVRTADDDATTCSARHTGTDPMRWCIRAAHHTGKDHVDETGYHWSDTVAVYPLADGVVKQWVPSPTASARRPVALATPCTNCPHPYNWHASHGGCQHDDGTADCPCPQFAPGERPEPVNPWTILGIDPSGPDGVAVQQAPAEDAQQADRRASLRNLLSRASAGLTPDEDALLRQHVEAELRLSDQLRAGRDTWRTKAEEIERDRDQHAAVLREVLDQFADWTKGGTLWPDGGVVARVSEEEWDRWDAVVAPTAERPWWQQVAQYEQAAADATQHVLELKRELEQAQAAVERVRALLPRDPRNDELFDRVSYRKLRAALDGTEQPTTEEPGTCTATTPDALGSPALHRCVAPAGHYDETREPVCNGPVKERHPGGWHTDGEGHVWSDRAANATPHHEQPTTKEN